MESPVQLSARVALRRHRGGRAPRSARDEMVVIYLAAANRDPAVFEDPHRFDVERANAGRHLAFSGGRHFCLGAALARAEGEVGLSTFFDRFPDVRPAGTGCPTRHPSPARLGQPARGAGNAADRTLTRLAALLQAVSATRRSGASDVGRPVADFDLRVDRVGVVAARIEFVTRGVRGAAVCGGAVLESRRLGVLGLGLRLGGPGRGGGLVGKGRAAVDAARFLLRPPRGCVRPRPCSLVWLRLRPTS